jgi:hypothetical protein
LTSAEVDHVLPRATALFEAVFGTEDPCIVVAQDWPQNNRLPWLSRIPPLFELAISVETGLKTPEGKLESIDEEEPEIGPCTLTWAEQRARTLHYRLVFEAIANADHARSPAISSRVYLINPLSNVIFYMYDDRGLDLIAARENALERLYHDFNAWILDYDRARINNIFAE